MQPDDLERLIDAELRRLPAPTAPPAFLPRVLAAAQPARPWYGRAWLTWPRQWRATAVVLYAAAVAAVWWTARGSWQPPAQIAEAVEAVRATAALTRVLWRALLEPAFVFGIGLVLVMSLVCGALWTALRRVASGGLPS